eukprot:3181130-Prymnesium_polylepis.1
MKRRRQPRLPPWGGRTLRRARIRRSSRRGCRIGTAHLRRTWPRTRYALSDTPSACPTTRRLSALQPHHGSSAPRCKWDESPMLPACSVRAASPPPRRSVVQPCANQCHGAEGRSEPARSRGGRVEEGGSRPHSIRHRCWRSRPAGVVATERPPHRFDSS